LGGYPGSVKRTLFSCYNYQNVCSLSTTLLGAGWSCLGQENPRQGESPI
jgi:hypothetical protein